MPRPNLETVPVHLHEEIVLVKKDEIKEAFLSHSDVIKFLEGIPAEKWSYRYGKDKWSIKGVVQHMIDGERIFCNRALVIARKDKTTPLLSFDQDEYAAADGADKRSKDDLISELGAVQQSSKKLFESFTDEQLMTKGTVNNYAIDVNTLGFVIIGHILHHVKLLKERYLA